MDESEISIKSSTHIRLFFSLKIRKVFLKVIADDVGGSIDSFFLPLPAEDFQGSSSIFRTRICRKASLVVKHVTICARKVTHIRYRSKVMKFFLISVSRCHSSAITPFFMDPCVQASVILSHNTSSKSYRDILQFIFVLKPCSE